MTVEPEIIRELRQKEKHGQLCCTRQSTGEEFDTTETTFKDNAEEDVDYKKLTEDLKGNKEHFQILVENINDLIWEIDRNGKYTYVNPKVKDLLGYKPGEVIGRILIDFMPKDEAKRIWATFQACIELHNPIIRLENTNLHRDGRRVIFETSGMPILDERGITLGFRGISRDVTKRKKLEEDLRKRTCKVEKLLKQKNEFIYMLSHDLKNPLTPLASLLPIVKEKEQDAKAKEMLDVSIRNVNSMIELITETLDLARLDDADAGIEFVNINLRGEFETVIKNNQVLFDNNIVVENNINENIIVDADKLLLGELISNLITNAVKYTPEEIRGTITINANEEKDVVTVSVKDTGVGLTKEQVTHVFDKFYKIGEPRPGMKSTGLGLAICKSIVEKHGGKIWVESPGPGKGSTFYFTISIAKKQ